LAQFAMLAQPHFGFAESPILVAHQAQHCQHLRLRELVFAEPAAVTRQHRAADLQGDASEGQESYFGHGTSCLRSRQQFRTGGYLEFSWS
jgi:hypothetical protein